MSRKFKKFLLTLAILIAMSALAGYRLLESRGTTGTDEQTLSRSGPAMDTLIRLSVTGKDKQALTSALDGAFNLLAYLEDEFSLYREGSTLSRINLNAGIAPVPVSDDMKNVLLAAQEAGRLTGGLFNPLVGPVTKLWKINQEINRDPDADPAAFALPAQASLDAVLPLVRPENLEIRPDGVYLSRRGAVLDLGGIAKGYASSRLAKFFQEQGIDSALIDLGGNIQVIGTGRNADGWNIGIRNPLDVRGIPALVLGVRDTAVITSGGYERYRIVNGTRYSHFFNPNTGMPVQSGLLSATLVTSDGAMADALATAFMIMGTDNAVKFLRAHREFDAVLIQRAGPDDRLTGASNDLDILVTENLKNKIKNKIQNARVRFF